MGSFDFHGDPVTIVSNQDGNWAVFGQLCRNLTLDPEPQRKAILRKSWSRGKTSVMEVQVPGDIQRRPQFLIHERIVPMWLANITTSRIADENTRRSIELAQVELADALYEYVSKRTVIRREPSRLEMARELVAFLEAKEALEAANKILAPKAGKWDRFLAADGLIGMREMADLFNVDVRVLTSWLVEINIFRRSTSQSGGARNLPRKPHQDSGLFVVKTETRNGWMFPVAYVTAKGLDLIADLWERRPYVA
ncbi:phage antirepressor KilAC domain-containing protein [Actinomycetota bacterium Odt1-20B]